MSGKWDGTPGQRREGRTVDSKGRRDVGEKGEREGEWAVPEEGRCRKGEGEMEGERWMKELGPPCLQW